MKIKSITKTMLKAAAKDFKEWYGVTVPMKIMVSFANTMSYNDIECFDTGVREALADFIAMKVVGKLWPSYGDGPSKYFFKVFKQKAPAFGIKVEFDE